MNSRTPLALALALALPLLGCSLGTGDKDAPSKAGAGAKAAPASPIAGWTEIDLGAHGPAWKGWRVKGPPGAAVKKSFDGLEIANKDGAGITVSFTALSLENTASTVREGVNYDQKPAILLQTKELLEWSSTFKDKSGSKTMYGFHLLVKTSGVTMGCKQASGVYDRAKLAPLQEACKTLVKK
jgi:hypothetical protein